MKKWIKLILVVLINIILVIFTLALSGRIFEWLFLPKNYLFYEYSFGLYDVFRYLFAAFIGLIYYNVFLKVSKKLKLEVKDSLGMGFTKKDFKRRDLVWIIIFIFIFYIGFTNFTYVTEEKIVKVSPFNLSGKEYSYSEVEKIETGFGSKSFAFKEYEEKGNFYYKITLEDKEIVFHMPTVNSKIERYDDTYLELEEFDKALTSLNIPKEASSKGYEQNDFDQRYVERFLRIIKLK